MIKYKGIPASSITYRKAVNHVSKKALFIGAHNDDCECAAGATAALLADKGYETVFLNPAVRHRTPLSGETFWEALRQQDEAARLLGARKIVMGPHGSRPTSTTTSSIPMTGKICWQSAGCSRRRSRT